MWLQLAAALRVVRVRPAALQLAAADANLRSPPAAASPGPTASGSVSISATMRVSGTYDGMFKRHAGSGALGNGVQDGGQDALFELSNGATLKNVVIGAPAADGVHCSGSCTLEYVWWEDVGEDTATLKGSSASQVMTIECSGARKASGKIFQHNGPGTMRLHNVWVEDLGTVYRSCGNCDSQHERHVEMDTVDVKAGKSTLAGINTNYNDTARFKNITVHDPSMKLSICDRYTGNNSGDEPQKTGSGADGRYGVFSLSDITWRLRQIPCDFRLLTSWKHIANWFHGEC